MAESRFALRGCRSACAQSGLLSFEVRRCRQRTASERAEPQRETVPFAHQAERSLHAAYVYWADLYGRTARAGRMERDSVAGGIARALTILLDFTVHPT